MKNEEIKLYLQDKINQYRDDFNILPQKKAILEEVHTKLEEFNFEEYSIKLEDEIRNNLQNWWINPKKGILREEELFAIYFEYDYFYVKGVEALSYGISEWKWKKYKAETKEFDMAKSYNFATGFEAMPGITLNFFDSLERLDYSDLLEVYTEEEVDNIEDSPEFGNLINIFRFRGLITIHEVFKKMDLNQEFEEINYKNNFMFLIGEHDYGKVYPLLIKEKNT